MVHMKYVVFMSLWPRTVKILISNQVGGAHDLAKFRISMIPRFMTSHPDSISRDAQRWTPDAIWFPRYFNPQANRIMYLECQEC